MHKSVVYFTTETSFLVCSQTVFISIYFYLRDFFKEKGDGDADESNTP